MDLDNIIPLFFLAFWVFAAIFGKKAKQKSAGRESKSPKSGFMDKIQTAVETISKEMQDGSSIDDFKLPYEKTETIDDIEFAVENINEKRLDDTRTGVVEKSIPEVVLPDKVERKTTYSKEKLREAFIWSEIIAPPLSLRD